MSHADPSPSGLHVRMLTDHGPRNVRARRCADESTIGPRSKEIVVALGTRWRWSPIQLCWVEVAS